MNENTANQRLVQLKDRLINKMTADLNEFWQDVKGLQDLLKEETPKTEAAKEADKKMSENQNRK